MISKKNDMAKEKSDIVTSKRDSTKSNCRKKYDNLKLMPVAIGDQFSIAKYTKIVAKRKNLNDEPVPIVTSLLRSSGRLIGSVCLGGQKVNN